MNVSIAKRKRRITISWIVFSFVASHIFSLVFPGTFSVWDAQAIDRLFLVRSGFDSLRPTYDKTVIHVDINNRTIQQLDNFYLNRLHYAQLVRNLAAVGTAAQVYDFIFAEPISKNEDKALIEAVSKAGNAYFGMAFRLTEEDGRPQAVGSDGGSAESYLKDKKWKVAVQGDASELFRGSRPLLTFPALANAACGLGFISIKHDDDGVYRRVPLLVRYEDAYYPSLPFRVVCDYLRVTPDRIVIEPGKSIVLKDARKPGKEPHDIRIPIDYHGNMIINFIGPWGSMKHYSFDEIFNASDDRDELEILGEVLAGKIALIADVATGSGDLGPCPTDVNLPLNALHTNVIHTIISEQFLRQISNTETLLIDLLLLIALLILALRPSLLVFMLGTTGVAAGFVGGVASSFLFGKVIVPVAGPVLFVGFSMALVTVSRYFIDEKEKAVLRATFEAYFPPSIVRKIMANPQMINSMRQKKELTILFSDIKNFTGYSASLTPVQIQKCLSEYFEAMVEIVFSYEGTVDKYIGDGLMVFFGDPDPQPDHALRCVRAAVDMQKKIGQLHEKWLKEGGMPIRIRIGINTGEVVVGNMGSSKRLSYTVLGSAVNLAQRLEANAPVGGIMISRRTYDLVKDHVHTRPLGKIRVKGIDEEISVYEALPD
ncbi:MAG: CHASE2 domain-containing protein [Syntrophobacteraceae bacterium]